MIASALGLAVTQGSIRIPNAEIAKLAAVLPLGTPVDVSSRERDVSAHPAGCVRTLLHYSHRHAARDRVRRMR